ncbi:hypothetical protein [Azospirillum oryzae]|uniref:hypothetical protein n=1 Tax=Azospirillum oryzae TaxID=286727 RepID=UPI001178B125|nr:hypothetical protein [Azospirillum oryzae]
MQLILKFNAYSRMCSDNRILLAAPSSASRHRRREGAHRPGAGGRLIDSTCLTHHIDFRWIFSLDDKS